MNQLSGALRVIVRPRTDIFIVSNGAYQENPQTKTAHQVEVIGD